MEIKRIETSKVVAAYESTGMIPVFGEWLDGNSNCACGLGAVLVAEKGMEDSVVLMKDPDKSFGEIFGLDPWYITGFVAAFDGDKKPYQYQSPEIRIPYNAGFADGVSAREAVLEKYPDTKSQ